MARKLKLKDIKKEEFRGLDPVVVIGFFDGVHKGHQKIINLCKDLSEKKGTVSIILTFDRPPLNVVKSRTYKKLILPFGEKIRILDEMNIDFIITAETDQDFLKLSPGDFCKDILLDLFGVKELFIGEGFRFGYRAGGDVVLLKKYLEPSGVKVNEVKLLAGDRDEVISSTTIRNHYAEGDILKISGLLGRKPFITGKVVKGAGRGKDLGFPTANLDVCDTLVVPKDGVYFGKVSVEGKDRSGMHAVINIGDNPTFRDSKKWIEAHIIDYGINLYDKDIKIEFFKRHRDEVRFSSSLELVEQIKKDVEEAKSFFDKKPGSFM